MAYDWIYRGRCEGKQDLFFPPRYEHSGARQRRIAQAKKVCSRCPVIDECRALGVECERSDLIDDRYYPDGIWGGLTRSELLKWADGLVA